MLKLNLVLTISAISFVNSYFTPLRTKTDTLILNYTRNEVKTNDHVMKTDIQVFPYVVAVLKKSSFLSAGALISDLWVLTGADPLFMIRDTLRIIRVRLGSNNYKRGGILLPIKYFEIHPYFDDLRPEFDVAMIRMTAPVRLTYNVNPIRIERKRKELSVTHLLATFWSVVPETDLDSSKYVQSEMDINRRRILQVSHLHPTNENNCTNYLKTLKVNDTSNLMCLEPKPEADPCYREAGTPVVRNGVLLGVMSSWTPENCEVKTTPSLVNLVSSRDIGSWIRAIIDEVPWIKNNSTMIELEDYYDENDNIM